MIYINIGDSDMKLNDIQEIIKKHSKEIEEKVIPVVTVKVMDSFHEGFKCGMDIGSTVIRDTTMEWLNFQLSEGNIETRDMEKFIGSYKDFIDSQKKNLEDEP